MKATAIWMLIAGWGACLAVWGCGDDDTDDGTGGDADSDTDTDADADADTDTDADADTDTDADADGDADSDADADADSDADSDADADSDSDTDTGEWILVWRDEFDGDNIDATKWEHEVNGQGGGNNELQYYTDRPENSRLENGCLVITALKETFTGDDGTREYTSARLRTLNQGDWTYGRFEIRARPPYGQGLWPAVWMLPSDWVYGGWAASGEIDIMELVGHDMERVHGSIHYGGEWPDNVHTTEAYHLPGVDFSEDFHTFALEWDEGEIRWYVDGTHYQTQTEWHSTGGPYPAPFDQRFHLLLNVAVGGNWPGPPDETTEFPQTMTVDYVRVYARR